MKPLDLSTYLPQWDYHDRRQDIKTALAWHAIKKTLQESEKIHLFEYIQSVRIYESSVIIGTKKPLINQELKYIDKKILANINAQFAKIVPQSITQIRLT